MGLSGAVHEWKWEKTHPLILNLLRIHHLLNTSNISIFHQKLAIFVISGNKVKNCILIHNLWFFSFTEFSKLVLFSVVAILMMSVKLITPDLIRIAHMVEIFKMWYFVIFYSKTIIYLKYWCAVVEKHFSSHSPWKHFMKKSLEAFCFNYGKKQLFHLLKHVLLWS